MNTSHSIDPTKDSMDNDASKNTATSCASRISNEIDLIATSANGSTEFDCLIAQYKAKVFEKVAFLYKP